MQPGRATLRHYWWHFCTIGSTVHIYTLHCTMCHRVTWRLGGLTKTCVVHLLTLLLIHWNMYNSVIQVVGGEWVFSVSDKANMGKVVWDEMNTSKLTWNHVCMIHTHAGLKNGQYLTAISCHFVAFTALQQFWRMYCKHDVNWGCQGLKLVNHMPTLTYWEHKAKEPHNELVRWKFLILGGSRQ